MHIPPYVAMEILLSTVRVENFAFFVGGCRTRKLKPAKGFVYACEIVTHPNSTKFTTRENFQIRQNIESHENLHPRNFLPVRYIEALHILKLYTHEWYHY